MAAAMKHMASNFAKLEKFEGVDFQRWQKKMHFLLSRMSVVYVLTTPMPEDGGDNPTVEQNVETSKELWDTLEAKYMAEDASSKKFLVSNFINYKMTDSRPVLEQYNELLGILQHKMNMDESIQVSCIIDKLPPSWKDFKHTLKHLKDELTLVELGSHLRIEKSLRAQDNDKPKGNNVVGLSVVNMVKHNNSSRYNDNRGKHKHHDTQADPNKKPKVTCWKCGKPGHLKKDCKAGNVRNKANGSATKGFRATVHVCKDICWFKTYGSLIEWIILSHRKESTGNVLCHVHFKRMKDMSKDGLIPAFDMDIENDLCDLHAIPSLGNKKYFVTFIDDASRTDRGGEYIDTLYFQYDNFDLSRLVKPLELTNDRMSTPTQWERMGTPTQCDMLCGTFWVRIFENSEVMSPPTRKKFRWGTVFPTGRKRYTDLETRLRIKRTNRKCRIPIELYPCQVEEKLIMRELEGKWIMKNETRMISKDGTISEFFGYTSSKEEEEEEYEEEEKEEDEE
ncbi:zinc finger, CCHC-type containing protein [Tanacetum coccineum]